MSVIKSHFFNTDSSFLQTPVNAIKYTSLVGVAKHSICSIYLPFFFRNFETIPVNSDILIF